MLRAIGVRIRKARLSDALKIRNVHVASIRGLAAAAYSRRQIESWAAGCQTNRYRWAMKHGESMFVAECGERLAGFSSLVNNEVRAVYVHPKFARRGIGSRLLAAIERKARAQGVRMLVCEASLNAHAFYKAHGYRGSRLATHTFQNGRRIRCVPLTKKLKDKF